MSQKQAAEAVCTHWAGKGAPLPAIFYFCGVKDQEVKKERYLSPVLTGAQEIDDESRHPPGCCVPDCELSDHTAIRRKLSDRISHRSRRTLAILVDAGRVIQKDLDTVVVERRQDLRAVTRKCRPAWDITMPEQRAAWAKGEKDRFYPCGESCAKTFGGQD